MKLNWASVQPRHVEQACAQLAAASRPRQRGLVIHHAGATLPAKDVLALAYRLANAMPASAPLRFASGEGSLRLLRALGFRAERFGAP
jgi:hypothetical protein